jgi:hypothetical protein
LRARSTSDHDRAGLRPLLALLFGKPHLRPDGKAIEVGTEDTVPMEIDLTPIGGLQEAVAFVRKELAHASVRGLFMDLHGTPLSAHVIL